MVDRKKVPIKSNISLYNQIPLVISGIALVVSVFAATVSFMNFRLANKYNEIGIIPILQTGGPIFSAPESVSFVANRGKGIAIIDDVIFRYSGAELKSDRTEIEFEKYKKKYEMENIVSLNCEFKVGKFWEGALIEPGQQLVMFETKGDCPRIFYLPFLENLNVEFLYSSQSGSKYRLIFQVASEDEVQKILE